jgi:uncharacterized protein with HEPN domain
MGKSRSTEELLADIALWGERVARFVDGVSKEQFARDDMRQLAVSKCIEVIGEASGSILKQAPDFADAHPEIGLIEAYRMRNRLSHGYDTIDWSILWDTATVYVPPLTSFARKQGAGEGG